MNGMRKSPLVWQPTELAIYKTWVWGTVYQKLAGKVQCSEKPVPLSFCPPQFPDKLPCYHNYTCLKPHPSFSFTLFCFLM